MMVEKSAFYVVRKGDMIGVYKTLSDCQDQAGSSVSDSATSVYKGYGMPIEAEKYLDSHGLKNATYSINVSHVKDDLFGKLVACPLQQPDSNNGKEPEVNSSEKRKLEVPQPTNNSCSQGNPVKDSSMKRKLDGFWPTSSSPQPKLVGGPPIENSRGNQSKLEIFSEAKPISSNCNSCILEFFGASGGNKGICFGAGAVLRAENGSVAYGMREGAGCGPKIVAEYRALILGLRAALKKGCTHICVRGDSRRVRMQMLGMQGKDTGIDWITPNNKMPDLYKVAMELKNKFVSFQIEYASRDINSPAGAHATYAIHLKDGEVEEIRMF